MSNKWIKNITLLGFRQYDTKKDSYSIKIIVNDITLTTIINSSYLLILKKTRLIYIIKTLKKSTFDT